MQQSLWSDTVAALDCLPTGRPMLILKIYTFWAEMQKKFSKQQLSVQQTKKETQIPAF